MCLYHQDQLERLLIKQTNLQKEYLGNITQREFLYMTNHVNDMKDEESFRVRRETCCDQ